MVGAGTEHVQISRLFRYREHVEIVNPDQSPTLDSLRRRLAKEGFDTLLLGRPPGDWAAEVTGLLVVSGQDLTKTFAVLEQDAEALEVLGDPDPHWLGDMFGLFAGPDFTAMFGSQADGQLLVAPSIGPRAARALWQQGIGYADAFGNVSLPMGAKRVEFQGRARNAKPVPVARPSRPARKGIGPAFSAAGLPVSLALMVKPELLGQTLRDIEGLVPASLGKVQEVVSALEGAHWITRGPHGRILQGQRMLDAWTEAYLARSNRWHAAKRYDPGLADGLDGLSQSDSGAPFWIGGEAAASRMGLPLRPSTLLLYLEDEVRPFVIKAMRLRPNPQGLVSFGQPLWSEQLVPGEFAPAVVVRADLIASSDPRQAEIAERMSSDVEDIRRLVHG